MQYNTDILLHRLDYTQFGPLKIKLMTKKKYETQEKTNIF